MKKWVSARPMLAGIILCLVLLLLLLAAHFEASWPADIDLMLHYASTPTYRWALAGLPAVVSAVALAVLVMSARGRLPFDGALARRLPWAINAATYLGPTGAVFILLAGFPILEVALNVVLALWDAPFSFDLLSVGPYEFSVALGIAIVVAMMTWLIRKADVGEIRPTYTGAIPEVRIALSKSGTHWSLHWQPRGEARSIRRFIQGLGKTMLAAIRQGRAPAVIEFDSDLLAPRREEQIQKIMGPIAAQGLYKVEIEPPRDISRTHLLSKSLIWYRKAKFDLSGEPRKYQLKRRVRLIKNPAPDNP